MKEALRDPRYLQAVELMARHERDWAIKFPNNADDNENM